jgi:hypothetical protein
MVMVNKKINKTRNRNALLIPALIFTASILSTIALYAIDNGQRNWLEVFTLWIIPTLALLYILYALRPKKTDKFGQAAYIITGLVIVAAIEVVVTFLVTVFSFGI